MFMPRFCMSRIQQFTQPEWLFLHWSAHSSWNSPISQIQAHSADSVMTENLPATSLQAARRVASQTPELPPLTHF